MMKELTNTIPELYGSLVFNDKVMRERLPKDTYKALRKTIQSGTHLELDVANTVAAAMKEWAVEHGATHFTHWFQPMTGFTAEKHDSFISPSGDGQIIMERSSSRESQTLPVSHPEDCGRPLRLAATPPGTQRLRRSSKMALCIYQQHSAPIVERRWIKRRRFFVRWKRSMLRR